MITREDIAEILYQVIDPDINYPIIDMGLIYDIQIQENSIKITYSLTSPTCPAGEQIYDDIIQSLRSETDYSDITAELVWNPLWIPEFMSEELRLDLGLPI